MEKLTRQKVFDEMQDEIKRIDTLNKLREEEKEETEEYYNENREPLSIDIKKEVTILLSWGGPSDGFKLVFDSENELLSGGYFIANWGEYEEVALNDDELDKVYNFYLNGDNSFLENK